MIGRLPAPHVCPQRSLGGSRRPGSAGVGLPGRLAPLNAANIGNSPATEPLSSHPDAVRRRERAAARKAAALEEGQRIQTREWWEGKTPSNLISAATPDAFKEAIQQDGLVVVDFFAPWCMACRRLFPSLLKIAENNPDVLFIKVNGGDSVLSKFVESLAVDKLPYFHFYRNGNLLSHFAANLTKISMLRAEIAAQKECNEPWCLLQDY